MNKTTYYSLIDPIYDILFDPLITIVVYLYDVVINYFHGKDRQSDIFDQDRQSDIFDQDPQYDLLKSLNDTSDRDRLIIYAAIKLKTPNNKIAQFVNTLNKQIKMAQTDDKIAQFVNTLNKQIKMAQIKEQSQQISTNKVIQDDWNLINSQNKLLSTIGDGLFFFEES